MVVLSQPESLRFFDCVQVGQYRHGNWSDRRVAIATEHEVRLFRLEVKLMADVEAVE
jgi:hypothetical protein